MGRLQNIFSRVGLGSPDSHDATDFLLTFDGQGVSMQLPARDSSAPSVPLKPGDRIFQDYTVKRLLGAGGFGEVYLVAMEPQGRAGLRYIVSDVPFALKRVRAADPARISALRDELRTWGELPQHPHLLRYRFFRISGDELYIASEFMNGGSLAGRLDAGSMTMASVIDIGLQIVWGVSALHAAGYLHGDLKPSNVLLDENGVTAQLCDYGLSLRLATDADGKWPRVGNVPRGYTPAFASPEQSRGAIDAATDIWSLGALLLAAAAPVASWSDWRSLRDGLQVWVEELPAGLAKVILASLQEDASARASLDEIEAGLREAWAEVSGGTYDRIRPPVMRAPRQELSREWFDARSVALGSLDPLFAEIETEEKNEVPDEARLDRLHQLLFAGPQDMTAIDASAGRTTVSQDVKILEMLEGACLVYRGLIREGRSDLVEDLALAVLALSQFHNRRGDLQASVDVMRRC